MAGRVCSALAGAHLVVLGAFLAAGAGADGIFHEVEVLDEVKALRAENKFLRAEVEFLKRQLEEARAPPSTHLHGCPGVPGGPPPRRLPEAPSRRLPEAGGGGGDADGGCWDDDETLLEAIMASGVVPPQFASFISCSSIGNWMMNPDADDVKPIWAMLGLTGQEPTCNTSLEAFCLLGGYGNSTCSIWSGVHFADLCCAVCGGPELATPNDTYHFGSKPWNDEAQAFIEVLEAFRVDEWYPGGIRAIPKNLCLWGTLSCEASGFRFWFTVGNVDGAFLSPAVGKLKHLHRLVLRGNIKGSIPPELGECTQLYELDLSGNKMTGTFPTSLSRLSKLSSFVAHRGNFGGELDEHLFVSWPMISIIDIAFNDFVGDLPVLNFRSTPWLRRVLAQGNNFSGLAGVIEPDPSSAFGGVSLELYRNNISVFPEALRWFRGLTSLDLAQNAISNIPSWGYYTHDQKFVDLFKKFGYSPGSEQMCVWKLWDNFHLAPPRWPDLRRVDLSSNPLSTSLQQFVVVFGQAPVLAELACEHCLLHGTLEHTFDLGFRLTEREVAAGSGRDCILEETHESLVKFSVADNPDIHGCDFIDAEGMWVPGQLGYQFEVRTRCGHCPSRQRVPLGVPTPLQSAKDCECLPTFIDLYTSSGKDCGCADGDFLDQGKQTCVKCSDSLDCVWRGQPEASRSAPELKEGFWMSCLHGKDFSVGGLYSCFSIRSCVGGDVNATDCSATSLCATGRTGRACSTCLPGHFGGPDGPCKRCMSTPEETWQFMAILAILAVPVLIVCMSILGTSKPQTSAAPPPAAPPPAALPPAEATGTGSDSITAADRQISGLAVNTVNTTVSIGRLASWTSGSEAMKVRVMFSQVVKYVQLLRTVGAMSVPWRADTAEGFDVMGTFGIDLPLNMFQVGCLSQEQSAEGSLLAKWVVPIGVVILMVLGALLSQLLSMSPSHWIQMFVIDRQLFSTFLYVLWATFLPGLMQNALEIFTCVGHPNGEFTVARYRDVTCLEGSWWFLAAGGGTAFIVYVLLFFLVSTLALRQVAKSLAASGLDDKGVFEFMVRSLRVSELDHNLRAALRDVIYNLIVAIFAGMGVTQLLLSAGVFLLFAMDFYDRQPYEHVSLNIIDAFCSLSIAALMLLSATIVHSSSQDRFFHARADAVQVLLVITVSVPVLIFAFELARLLPVVQRILPPRMRPLTRQSVQAQRASLRAAERNDLWEYIAHFDGVEFRRFMRLFYGSEANALGRDGSSAGGPGQGRRRRSTELVLGAAGEQVGSPAARLDLASRSSRSSRSSSRTSGGAGSAVPRASMGQSSVASLPDGEEVIDVNEEVPCQEEVNNINQEAQPHGKDNAQEL